MRLNINASRRAAKQRNENRIHNDEENCNDELPGCRRILSRHAEMTRGRHNNIERRKSRPCASRKEENGCDRPDDDRSCENKCPRSVRRTFPRRERQTICINRGPRPEARGLQPVRECATLLAFQQMRGVRLRIFEIPLTRNRIHKGSTYESSASLRRLRARKSLFFTVPSGSFFIDAISS